MHVVCDGSLFVDTNLPRKFAKHEICVGIGSLKMFVSLPEIVCG